jgi:hypothetical protein
VRRATMGQRFKKSSLFFGQTAKEQEPPKPTLSGFYRGVGEAQTGAVRDIGQKVQEQTATLPEQFGVKSTPEGKTEFADKSAFKPIVATPSTAVLASTLAGTGTAAQAQETAGQAQANIQKLKEEQAAAQAAAGESVEKALKGAGEKSTEAQQQLTEKNLGERKEASQLEQAAKDYRNILQTTPGTSNVAAVANLMKFYDPKYLSLESSLRQGEMSLARQEAGAIENQLAQAESERGASVEGYKQQAAQSYKDIQDLIGKEKEKYLGTGSEKGSIAKFYEGKIGQEEATKQKAEEAVTERTKTEREEDDKIAGEKFGAIEGVQKGVKGVLSAISGRGSDNWLNKRGHEVLGPISGEMTRLSEEARALANAPNVSGADKKERLDKINDKMKEYKTQAASELAAFLGDTNTHPGDALDAAEQIVASGLIDSLNEDQKRMILNRIKSDSHIETENKYKLSSPEKLQKIYVAFGGKELLLPKKLFKINYLGPI